MAVQKIEYQNKEAIIDDPSVPEVNKVTDDNMNEIKSVVNNNADELQNIDLSGYQLVSNLVTSVSSASTDTEYPSAKLFYDTVGDLETILETLDTGNGVS